MLSWTLVGSIALPSRAGPTQAAVAGINCITPIPPSAAVTMRQPLSCQATALTKAGSTPYAAASAVRIVSTDACETSVCDPLDAPPDLPVSIVVGVAVAEGTP